MTRCAAVADRRPNRSGGNQMQLTVPRCHTIQRQRPCQIVRIHFRFRRRLRRGDGAAECAHGVGGLGHGCRRACGRGCRVWGEVAVLCGGGRRICQRRWRPAWSGRRDLWNRGRAASDCVHPVPLDMLSTGSSISGRRHHTPNTSMMSRHEAEKPRVEGRLPSF